MDCDYKNPKNRRSNKVNKRVKKYFVRKNVEEKIILRVMKVLTDIAHRIGAA